MDQSTLLSNLSSAIHSVVENLQSPEFLNTTNNFLSSVQQLSGASYLSEIDNLVCALTSVPLHPYQNLIWNYFDQDHNFKTIDDVPEPVKIPMQECLEYINQKEQEINKTLFHNLTCQPEQQITSHYETLSGDQIICDFEKQKKYLEFFEMVRQIPLDSITPENNEKIINKIIAEYIKVI